MKYIEDSEWHSRRDAAMPYQVWRDFHPYAVVEVYSLDPSYTNIGVAFELDWRYHRGLELESTILHARHLRKNGKLLYRVKATHEKSEANA